MNEVSGQNDFSSRSKIRPVLRERVNLRGQNKSGALFKPTTFNTMIFTLVSSTSRFSKSPLVSPSMSFSNDLPYSLDKDGDRKAHQLNCTMKIVSDVITLT